MVQAVLPRFVYPGDTLQIEALVHNGTGNAGQATVAVALDGMERTEGPARANLAVDADAVGRLPWPVRVQRGDQATVSFAADLGIHAGGPVHACGQQTGDGGFDYRDA